MCECMDDSARKSRATLMGCMWALTDQHGHTETPIIKYDWKREMKKIYTDPKEGQRHSNLEPTYLTHTDWQTSWNKAQEGLGRTFTEELQGRIMETFVWFNATQPTWTGVITKTWIWCLKKIGIKESSMVLKGSPQTIALPHDQNVETQSKTNRGNANRAGNTVTNTNKTNTHTMQHAATSKQPSILNMFPLQNLVRSTNSTSRGRNTREYAQLVIQQDGNQHKCVTSVVQPTECWGSNNEAPTTVKDEQKELANEGNRPLTEMFEAQRQRQKNRGRKRKTTPPTCSNINKRTKPQTPTHDRTTKRKRIVEKRITQTTPKQQQKINTPVNKIITKKQKTTGRRGAASEGRIYKGKKNPREQYICDMQAWMDGKRTTEVVGVKYYTKPKSGKTAKFNNTDLKYYIKCGYYTVKSENKEQTQHRQEGGTHITL